MMEYQHRRDMPDDRMRLENAATKLKEKFADADNLPFDVRMEAIAACNVVLGELVSKSQLPINPHYDLYESVPEVIFHEHFDERFTDLCPLGVKWKSLVRQKQRQEATLHAAWTLGHPSVKLSRSGFNIIFSEPQGGRYDLCSSPDQALRQIKGAGLDPEALTDEQFNDWQLWRKMRDKQWLKEHSCFLVTRTKTIQVGEELVPANSVILRRWDDVELFTCTQIRYWDDDAINRIGERGAFCFRPDHENLMKGISAYQKNHPELSSLPIKDNSGSSVILREDVPEIEEREAFAQEDSCDDNSP